MKFPRDAPLRRTLAALGKLGFAVVREGNHIALQRKNADGTITPMTIPNHPTLKSSTLRAICRQAGSRARISNARGKRADARLITLVYGEESNGWQATGNVGRPPDYAVTT